MGMDKAFNREERKGGAKLAKEVDQIKSTESTKVLNRPFVTFFASFAPPLRPSRLKAFLPFS